MNIVSNISYIDPKKIELTLPDTAAPREILKTQLEKLSVTYPNKTVVLAIRFIGRRIVKLDQKEKFVKLLDGRRHSIYYGIKNQAKVHINFVWYKLKHLSHTERKFLLENLNENSFESWPEAINEKIGNARFLIEKTGGIALENLLYRYTNILSNSHLSQKSQTH